jgi:hypothetical protein
MCKSHTSVAGVVSLTVDFWTHVREIVIFWSWLASRALSALYALLCDPFTAHIILRTRPGLHSRKMHKYSALDMVFSLSHPPVRLLSSAPHQTLRYFSSLTMSLPSNQSAVGPDGNLLDASQIQWYEDADSTAPIVSTTTTSSVPGASASSSSASKASY